MTTAIRTYYLSQMRGWGRRMPIMIDWTFALMFRPETFTTMVSPLHPGDHDEQARR